MGRKNPETTPGEPPDTFVFASAVGSVFGLLSKSNQVLSPTPLANSTIPIQENQTKGFANLSTPIGGSEPDIYGDQTIHMANSILVDMVKPNTIVLNQNIPSVTDFFNEFFGDMQTQIQSSGYSYAKVQSAESSLDPHL